MGLQPQIPYNGNMFHVALWEPEIAPNTGNIGRLCVATGATLHLIGRIGFRLDDRSLRRAGLDYWSELDLRRYTTMNEFLSALPPHQQARLSCFSAHAEMPYTTAAFQDGDVLLFGNESHGLPESILRTNSDRAFVIPMPTGKVRSLNLATAVGIIVYEALRQLQVSHDGS